jgi:hypothetical protein
MANEFRVKNGLIVDEVSSGAGVLSIIDSNITSDDGSIEVTVVDGQTVSLGKIDEASASIVIAPHGTAGSELITLLNTSGTDAAAIALTATAGGIDINAGDMITVDAADEIVVTTTSADGHISLVSAHTAGEAIHLDGNANVGSIVKIDAGILDINVDDALTIDAADEIVITTGSADGHISLVTAHTAGVAFHLDANADAASEVQIDAGILDIDVTGAVTLDSSAAGLSLDGVLDSNITVTASGQDLDLIVAGGGTQELRIASAGTGASALHLNASAGGINIDSADMIDIDAADEITITTTSADGHISLVTAHTAGVAFHLDANANAASEVQIDAGILDIDVTGASTFDTGGVMSFLSAGAANFGAGGDIIIVDNGNDTFIQSDTVTIGPKTSSSNAATSTVLTVGNAAASGNNADRAIHLATSEAVYRIALNLDGSTGNMPSPVIEMGVGGTLTENTTTGLPTQAEYTTADTAFAFGADGSVYRIGKDDATNGQVLTFDGTEWLASDVSGTGDVAAAANFATDNVLIRSDGTSKGVQFTGITVADTTNNMSGIGSIGSKQIAIAPASDAGVAALLITPIDVDKHGIDINSSITTANVLDITADTTTTGQVINISADGLTGTGGFMKMTSTGLTVADTGTSALINLSTTNDSVGSQTSYGLLIDYNKSGVTASGKTAIVAGIAVDVDDAATNHGSGTATIYGGIFTSNSANAGGTIKNVGIHATAAGGDTNYAGEFAGDMLFTSDTATFTSSNANDPLVIIENTTDDVNGATLRFVKDRGGAGTDGMDIGTISFVADNASQEQTAFASIVAEVSTAANTDEAGKLSFFVSESNGTAAQLTAGLILVGQPGDDGEVDVTIGAGAGSTTTIAGHLTVNGTTTTINSSTVTIDDLSFNMAADVTTSANLDGAGIILGATNYASGSSFANNPTLLYDHTGTRWEFSSHDVEMPADVFIGNDLSLTSDGALFTMGADSGFIITHDSDIGATIAGSPLTITAAEASTWSTSAGALTLTAAAASTWSTAAGALTLTSAAACTWSTTAGILTLDGDDGIQISSTAAGNIDLDSFADIVLDSADDKHIIFQQAGVSYLSIGQGTVAVANIEDSVAAPVVIDAFNCNVHQAVKYLVLVQDVTGNDEFLTAELMVLGDASAIDGSTKASAFMTTYAVVYSNTELGTFSAAGNANNSDVINLMYDPLVATGGTLNHKVRVVAQRIASI